MTFISSMTVSKAHSSDITDLVVTEAHTITVSSDGSACFWNNKQSSPIRFNRIMVSEMGIHHVAVYQKYIRAQSITVVAFACFDGKVLFMYYLNNNIAALKPWKLTILQEGYWAPAFFVDPESKQDYFVCTHISGITHVFQLNLETNSNRFTLGINKYGEIGGSAEAFPVSLCVTTRKGKLVAIGYDNGDVQVYGLETLSLIHELHSTDFTDTRAKSSDATISTAFSRVVQFSPDGSLLAVGFDDVASGLIFLYDMKIGTNVGTLTSAGGSEGHNGWVMGLSFDSEGERLASCGLLDKCVKVWDLNSRTLQETIDLSISDLEDTTGLDSRLDVSLASGVKFINKGTRDGSVGLCVISFDRGIRWYTADIEQSSSSMFID